MNDLGQISLLDRLLEDEARSVERVVSRLRATLEASRSGPAAALQGAVDALAREVASGAERTPRRTRALEALGGEDLRLRALTRRAGGAAGDQLRAREGELRALVTEAQSLSRTLGFVVSQVLRVNAGVLQALTSAAAPGAYTREGAQSDARAGAAGVLRGEA